MKKTVLSLLIITTFCLSGCGDSPAEDQSNISNQSFIGQLQVLSVSVSGLDVTHVLVTEAKERIYLRSLLIDLSDYEDQKVRLFGELINEEVAGKPVKVITVSSLDSLDSSADSEGDLSSFSSKEMGLSFKLDDSKFELDQSNTRLILTSIDSSGAIFLKLMKANPELDFELYLSQNYTPSDFSKFKLGSVSGLSNENSSNKKLVYLFQNGEFFYELSYIGDNDLPKDEKVILVNDLVSSINFIEVENDAFNLELEKIDESSNTDSDASNTGVSGSNESKQVSSKYAPVISSFEAKVSGLLPKFKSAGSYSFTDNGYFYVIYLDENSTRYRSLIKYSSSNFEVIAEFERGTNVDWNLVTGANIAYDRAQDLVIVSESGPVREVKVEKGYRYFESLPLGFGIQYPQNWYYSRVEDAYIFSNEPLEGSSVKVRAELLKVSYDSADGSQVKPGLKKASSGGATTYNAKVGKYTLRLTGSSEFSQQLELMASSVSELNFDN
jgi:hypothetical protein